MKNVERFDPRLVYNWQTTTILYLSQRSLEPRGHLVRIDGVPPLVLLGLLGLGSLKASRVTGRVVVRFCNQLQRGSAPERLEAYYLKRTVG